MAKFRGGDKPIVVSVEDFEGFLRGNQYLLRDKKIWFCTLISSSESVSFIFLAIIVRNSKETVSYSFAEQSNLGPTREVNGAIVVCIDLVDHVLKFGLAWILAQRPHDSP